MSDATILYVDNTPGFADLISNYLGNIETDIEIVAVGSVSEGRNYLSEQSVECIISEHILPDQSGIEFLDYVRSKHPDLPYIIYTVTESDVLASEAFEKGATGFVEKNYGVGHFQILANRVENAIKKYKAQRVGARRFESVFEDPNILVGLLDLEGKVLNINQTAINYLDTGLEEIRGEKFWNTPWFTGDETLQREVQQLADRAADGEYIEFQFNLSRSMGKELIINGVFRPVTNEDGVITSLIISGRDITDRIQQKRTLAESEARYQSLSEDVLDTSGVGTFILNAKFEVVWINAAVEEYFGIDRDSALDTDKKGLIKKEIKGIFEDSERFSRRVLQTYEDNSYTEEFECHILPNDELEERWLKHWSQPIETGLYEGGRIEHYTDITERKQRDQQLDVMDRVLRHNLHNSMNIIVGNAELISSTASGEIAARASDIQSCGNELLEITEKQRQIVNLLSAAPDIKPVNVTGIINKALKVISEEYPDAAISLSELKDVKTKAVPELETAIIELVENAIIHADQPAPPVEIKVIEDTERVRILICDVGPEIPVAERAILRGDGERGPLYHGNGMGLWLVNWIITYSDGSIQCQPNHPEGNIIEISLPREE